MTPRGIALAAVGFCVVTLAGCGLLGRKRSETAEAGLAAGSVFETEQPYSSSTVADTDFARFFTLHPEYRADSAAVADFYERRTMQFAWILNGYPAASAQSFIAFASAADSTAPNHAGFPKHLIELYEESAADSATALCPECATDLELHLTAEFFRFAARNYGGYLSRDLSELNWFIPRAKKDAGQLLDSLATGTMDLADFEPVHPQYQQLKRGIAQYSALSGVAWPALALPRGRAKLVPGDTAAVLGEIRHRLQLLGDTSDARAGIRYDSTMGAAVRRFQERHGVQADGVIGAAFLRALNVPIADRLRTMLVNIERLRWVPEQRPPNLLLVNIPEFRLHVYEDGKEVSSMEVVVGATATAKRTVVFSDVLSRVVFSPSWTVPANITRREIMPAMRANPNYLASHDMEVVGGSGATPEIRQRPGPKNPLGGAKFLFPNSYDIYMHDTPSRALFERDVRAGSHGCIRLVRAGDLAEYLLKSDPEWPAARIRAAMTSGVETTVQLREKRPVMIGYFTAWVDDAGRLNFRDDVYGHDAKLAGELFVQ